MRAGGMKEGANEGLIDAEGRRERSETENRWRLYDKKNENVTPAVTVKTLRQVYKPLLKPPRIPNFIIHFTIFYINKSSVTSLPSFLSSRRQTKVINTTNNIFKHLIAQRRPWWRHAHCY